MSGLQAVRKTQKTTVCMCALREVMFGRTFTSSVPLLELSRGMSHCWVPDRALAPSSVLLQSANCQVSQARL